MRAIETVPHAPRPIRVLALLTFGVGVVGMGVSFLFLASIHALDVIAGAAGFIAGAILVGAGLLASTVRRPYVAGGDQGAAAGSNALAIGTPEVVQRWLAHFQRNRANRPEPDWSAPMALGAEVVRPLVRSLEQFQLGDGGGPAYLIAYNREQFLAGAGTRTLVDLWFAEEREHARLLGAAVARFGGQCIDSHWSFTAFCLTRRVFGVRFELTVLLLTEIVSTVYYRLLHRHSPDAALRAMCRLILRDEMGHVAFHRARLAQAARAGQGPYGLLWEMRFRVLGLAAASMLWINHAPGLEALGARRGEYYGEVWRALSRFIQRLRREARMK